MDIENVIILCLFLVLISILIGYVLGFNRGYEICKAIKEFKKVLGKNNK